MTYEETKRLISDALDETASVETVLQWIQGEGLDNKAINETVAMMATGLSGDEARAAVGGAFHLGWMARGIRGRGELADHINALHQIRMRAIDARDEIDTTVPQDHFNDIIAIVDTLLGHPA